MSPARQPKLIQLFTASSRLRVSLMPRLIFLLVVSSFASPLSTLRVFKGNPTALMMTGKPRVEQFTTLCITALEFPLHGSFSRLMVLSASGNALFSGDSNVSFPYGQTLVYATGGFLSTRAISEAASKIRRL